MEIIGKSLTDCQIDPSGELFRLNLTGVDGSPASLVLPVECLRSLMMTLPDAIERAVRARHGACGLALAPVHFS